MVNDRWRARLAIAIVRPRATDQAGPGLLGPLAGAGNHGVGVVPGRDGTATTGPREQSIESGTTDMPRVPVVPGVRGRVGSRCP